MHISLALCLLLLLLASPALAVDYWVATTGSDGNACGAIDSTEQDPPSDPSTYKLTMTSATACLASGDRLIIKDGTYSGTGNSFPNNIPAGTSGNPTVIRAQNIALPTSVEIIMDSAQSVGVHLSDDAYVTFEGVKLNGKLNSIQPMRINGASHNVVLNYVDITNENLINRSCILAQTISSVNPNNVQITRSRIHHCGTSRFQHGIYWGGGSGWVLRWNEIDHHGGYGLHFYTSPTDSTIEFNKIHDNCTAEDGSCSQVILSNDRHKFNHNLVYTTDEVKAPSQCVGLTTGDNQDASEIDNNVLYNCAVIYGVEIGASATNIKVRNNHILGNGTAIQNNGTGTTLTTNRTTGSITDCTVSTTDLTQKASSSCIDAGTAIAGLSYNGSAPDQGAFETWVHATCAVEAATPTVINITKTNNVASPVLPSTGITTYTAREDAGAKTVSSVVRVGDNQVNITVSAAFSAGTAIDYSWASGNLTDSSLVGNTINQPFLPVTNQSCTNNVSGAPTHVWSQATYEWHGLRGTEAAPVIKPDGVADNGAAENLANMDIIPGGSIRLRIAVTCTTADCPSIGFIPRYSRNAGSYTVVPDVFAADNIAFCGSGSDPDIPASGTATTNQLSTAGTFVVGALVRTSNAIPTSDLALNGKVENEYCFSIDSDEVATTTFDIRLYNQDGSTITYTVTPRMTVIATQAGVASLPRQPWGIIATPNFPSGHTTVTWQAGMCQPPFAVSLLQSGKWVKIGETHDTWLEVPLRNTVSQPYGVSAVCP